MNTETTISINMDRILNGIGTTRDDRRFFTLEDIERILANVSAKFKGSEITTTTAEISGWCPGFILARVVWTVSFFASRLFLVTPDKIYIKKNWPGAFVWGDVVYLIAPKTEEGDE